MTDFLTGLGWTSHFADQVEPDDTRPAARVTEVKRRLLVALAEDGPLSLLASGGTGAFAAGDWVLHDGIRAARLTPTTEIARRAAGDDGARQLIAANVGTMAVVTSCNADFSPARLERYLAIALGAGCEPLVVLTKADQADDPEGYAAQARALAPGLTVLALDARDEGQARRLDPWCGPGLTLALVGSSGVGKTTIQNALTGTAEATQAIREDDARGRHTTTARSLRRTLAGGSLIDTPGMRELGLTETGDGVGLVFAEIADLATRCRFRDCTHAGEPGCAVRAAIAAGTLDAERLARYEKLEREDGANTQALHERRARAKGFGRMVKEGKARGQAKRRAVERDG